MCACEKCGEGLVCTKCTPQLIESNGTIIVTHKDKAYNGGMPNHLIIAPSRVSESGTHYSVAVIVGDNFWKESHYEMRDMTVSEMAYWIANSDSDYMHQKFKVVKGQRRAFNDLQTELKRQLDLRSVQK